MMRKPLVDCRAPAPSSAALSLSAPIASMELVTVDPSSMLPTPPLRRSRCGCRPVDIASTESPMFPPRLHDLANVHGTGVDEWIGTLIVGPLCRPTNDGVAQPEG